MTPLMVSSLLLYILRLGIGSKKNLDSNLISFPEQVDWNSIEALAEQHGLSGVLIDGVEKLPESLRPPKSLLSQWVDNVMQEYEYRYELYRRAIAEMAAFYNSHGIRMMVIKGLACSLDWPKPEHRPCGDIDIWQFGEQKEADALLAREKNVEIDSNHHHHTVFFWRDFFVENHYDFMNVRHHKSNVEIEAILKELGKDDSHYVELYGERVYLPSPNLHALFLLRHSMGHFASTSLSLRQLLDWAFFVIVHGDDVDWEWLTGIVERYGMMPMFLILNAICVEDLGFDSSIFHQYLQCEPQMKERVLNDILSPEFTEVAPESFLKRIPFKYRRWKANNWKHKLCYNESLWSAFWSGVWNHLLKPRSI